MDLIHIIAAGGSPILQAGFAAVLGRDPTMRFVGLAPNVREYLERDWETPCDVLLLNTHTPHEDAALALQPQSAGRPGPPIVVLTNNEDVNELRATLRLGVRGYGIRRVLQAEDVIAAVRTVHQGRNWVCPRTTQLLMDGFLRQEDGVANVWHHKLPISERELDVLRLVAAGAREQDIASQLVLSRNTVKTYLRRIRTKLQVDSSLSAVQRAVTLGLLTPPDPGGNRGTAGPSRQGTANGGPPADPHPPPARDAIQRLIAPVLRRTTDVARGDLSPLPVG